MTSPNVCDRIHDGWWEEMNHDECARFFFNESRHITKGRFFHVCCRTWMEDLLLTKSYKNEKVTYFHLWSMLKQIYSSGTRDSSGIVRWILPDLTPLIVCDEDSNDHHDAGTDINYKSRLLKFWNELYRASEDESSASSHECQIALKSKRASKRRRLGYGRFTPYGFKDILKGRYKLPAVYLMISLLKKAGVATDWWSLCDLAHELPSIFKTFAENDILAGLALVGLADIGKPFTGISASNFFTTYFSGIDSYGPSILSILHEATDLSLYNLRASICRQVLDHLETYYDEWSEDYKSDIINACVVCIDQEHPERFLDDLKRKHQELEESLTNNLVSKYHSIPDLFASPGFPLLVHIQIWLLGHQVERASELTRKMDSCLWLNDEVRDDAWFNIWYYLLAEGRLFLDGNLDTPGYLKKREFLYNFMSCQVSQNAKIAMIDFYQEVANRACEREDATLEEKQYILLACQQTVLRLLLKMRGLGSNTILEFVQETVWPVDIPGQKSAQDLNIWAANFLLQNRKVPSSLIDKTTGLVDLLKRIKLDPETKCGGNQVDNALASTKGKGSSGAMKSPKAETNCHLGVEELSRDDDRQKLSTLRESDGLRKQEMLNPSSLSNNFENENESKQYVENGVDDEEIEILNYNDDSDEELIVENEDNVDAEVLDIDDDDVDEDTGDPYVHLPNDVDEDDKMNNFDDAKETIYDVRGNEFLEEESKNCDTILGNYDDERETEILHINDREETLVEDNYVGSDDGDDDRNGETEEKSRVDKNCHQLNKNGGRNKNDNDLDEGLEDSDDVVNDEDVECDNNDRTGASIHIESIIGSSDNDHSNASQEADEPSNIFEVSRVLGADVYGNTADSDASSANNESLPDVKSDREDVETENFQLLKSSPLVERQIDNHQHQTSDLNQSDATSSEQKNLQKGREARAVDVAALGGDFGDTTEEEDGNYRLRANRTAQADRRADVLQSGIGYASQVEDGYEPEDTHGYTEEEVSEAINTEDEEDERVQKQYSRSTDIDSTQNKAGLISQNRDENEPCLFSHQSHDIVGNKNRQNSIEPTSDDMDMADERTEQEEDVAAEFSELEETPVCSSELKLAASESKQAKTLLEFAQKAQNKDNWALQLKDSKSNSDEKRNDPQQVRQNDSEGGLHRKETEFDKRALSFDADDEKYATEGCKSLETEVEEDIQKQNNVENLSYEEMSTMNDKYTDRTVGMQDVEIETGSDDKDIDMAEVLEDETQSKKFDEAQGLLSVESEIAASDIEVATVLVNTDSGGVIFDAISKEAAISKKVTCEKFEKGARARETEFEVQELVNKDGSSKFNARICNETKTDALEHCEDSHPVNEAAVSNRIEEVLPCERSAEIRTNDDGRDYKVIDNEAQVNDLSDNVSDSNEVERSCENGNVFPQIKHVSNHDSELTSKEKAAFRRKGRDIDCDDVVSEDGNRTTSHNITTLAHSKGLNVAHSVGESRLEVSNVDGGNRDSSFHSKEGSISMDEVNIADSSCSSHDGASSCDSNTQQRVQDGAKNSAGIEEQKAKIENENEVNIDEESLGLKDDTRSDADVRRSNEDGYDNFTDDAGSEGVYILGTQVVVQEDNIDSIVNDTSNDSKNSDMNSQRLQNDRDDQIKGNTCKNVDGFGMKIEKSNLTMDTENKFDGIDSSYGDTSNKKRISEIVPNQLHMKEFKDVPTSNLMNHTDIQVLPSHDEEALGKNDPVEEEPSDIPQFIGGDSKQEFRKSTRRFGKKKSDRQTDDGTTASSSSTPRVVHEAFAISNKGVTDTIHTKENDAGSNVSDSVDDDGGGSVTSDNFCEFDQKKRKRNIDDERSAFLSSASRGQNDASKRKKKENTDSRKRSDGDEDSAVDKLVDDIDGEGRSETSLSKASVQVDEPPARATSASTPTKCCNNVEDINSSIVAKRNKDRSDLPPIPPKEMNRKSKQTITQSKGKKRDELSAQSITSRRSTRSAGRKLPSITELVNERGGDNSADDTLSVKSMISTRSTRSANRKLAHGTKLPERKDKDIDDDDDVSAQSKVSRRSTRSAGRKLPSITEPKGGDNATDNNVPMHSMISTRSTRSANRKLAHGAKTPEWKGKDIDDDDDVSAQSKVSRRSTRSAGRKLPSITEPKGGDNIADDNVSVQSMVSTRSTRSATRKSSCGTIGPKRKGKDIEDDDNLSNQSKASIRSTRSVTRNRSSVARSTKQKGKEMKDDNDDDNASIQSRTSTRSTRSATRKRISVARLAKQKDVAADDVSVQSIASRSATTNISSSSVGTLNQKDSEINHNGDDELIQSITSTRNTTWKASGDTTDPKHIGEDVEQDDDMSIRSMISTRSSTRKIISGSRIRKLKDEEIENKEGTEDHNGRFSNWTVKMLQAELKKRNIKFSTKLRKKELVEMLQSDSNGKEREKLI